MNKHGSFAQVVLSNKTEGRQAYLMVSQLEAHVLGSCDFIMSTDF